MRKIGLLLLLVGLVLGAYALFIFDPSVSSGTTRVANIQRLSFQQNLLIASGILAIIGAVLLTLGPRSESREGLRPQRVPFTAVIDANLDDDEAFAEAIRTGDFAAMRESLESRTISPHGRNRNGRGWLQFATIAGAVGPCQVLLEYGAFPSDKDDMGATAIAQAAASGNEKLIELYLAVVEKSTQRTPPK